MILNSAQCTVVHSVQLGIKHSKGGFGRKQFMVDLIPLTALSVFFQNLTTRATMNWRSLHHVVLAKPSTNGLKHHCEGHILTID